ncbi:MAG TPA: hypothetical protein VIG91_01060 [Terriglobales bacterium]
MELRVQNGELVALSSTQNDIKAPEIVDANALSKHFCALWEP